MKLDIFGQDGSRISISAADRDGNFWIQLHTGDGGMAACDFSKENMNALVVGIQLKVTQALQPST